MHQNYHFLKFLCPELQARLAGFTIHSCFSQNKDELVILFELDGQSACIRANLLPIYSCLSFPEDFKRSKKNTVNLFDEWIGQKVQSVAVFSNERAFKIVLESGDWIVFKLYGTRSNILYYKNNELFPLKIFRNELREDFEIDKTKINVTLDLSFEAFCQVEGNASRFLPTLGKIPRDWLKSRGYIEASLTNRWKLINEVLDMLDSPMFAIVIQDGEHNISMLPESQALFTSHQAVQAINELFKYRVIVQTFQKEKVRWIKHLEDQLKKSRSYIQKTEEKLLELLDQISPSQKADVIMANLHQIPSGATKATLFNFYSNREEEFSWKQGISPQKVAETLYRKSKNRKIELEQLEKNLQSKEALIDKLNIQKETLQEIHDFKRLRQYLKDQQLISTSQTQDRKSVV